MKWDLGDGPPPGGTGGCKVFLDGQEQQAVTGFDTLEGWVDARCLDGHTGYPGIKHVDPADSGACCNAPRRYGAVSVVLTRGLIARTIWWCRYRWGNLRARLSGRVE